MYYKTLLALAALNLVSCEKPTLVKPESTAEAEVRADAKSALSVKMKTPLKYLDIDAEYLKLNNLTGEVEFVRDLSDDVESLIRKIAKKERVDLPTNVSLKGILKELQLDALTGLSSSSKQVEGGWLNKFFISNNETNDGLYAIYKEKEQHWGVLDFAPEGADLVMEQSQNLDAVADLLKYSASVAGEDYVKLLNKALAHKPQASDQTIAEDIDGLILRTSLVIDFDESQKKTRSDGTEIFNIECAVRIDGGATAWKFFSEDIEKDSEVEEKDGLRYVKSPKSYEVYEGLPKIQPMFVVDKENDQLWFVLRAPYFEVCKGSGKKLKDSAEFTKMMKPLDKTGFSLSYTSASAFKMVKNFYSKDFMQKFYATTKSGYENKQEVAMMEAGIDMMADKVLPQFTRSSKGYASTWKLQPEGLLMSSYDAFPSKGLPVASHELSIYPLMGMYLAPEIEKQVQKTRVTMVLSNSKDIYVGMRDYSLKKGNLPGSSEMRSSNEALREFFKEYCIIDEKPFFANGIKGFVEGDGNTTEGEVLKAGENIYAYYYGADIMRGKANRPLLIAPLKKLNGKIVPDAESLGGQMVVLSCDGAAFVINLTEDGTLPKEYSYVLDHTADVWKDKDGNSPAQLPLLLPEPKN